MEDSFALFTINFLGYWLRITKRYVVNFFSNIQEMDKTKELKKIKFHDEINKYIGLVVLVSVLYILVVLI